jgi:hypothetical protein
MRGRGGHGGPPLQLLLNGALHESTQSAEGAQYDSQGQVRSEAERVAPGCDKRERLRPERPKYHRYYALSGLHGAFDDLSQGRRASLRSRLPLAIIFRAVGALFRLFVQSRSTGNFIGSA